MPNPNTGATSPIIASPLTNGATYRARVRARNAAGWGPYLTDTVTFEPSPAAAYDLYAAPGGSDTTGTGTFANPYASIQKLADELSAGQTGALRGGTYTQYTTVGGVRCALTGPTSGGTSGNPITIESYPTETAIVQNTFDLTAPWLVFRNLIVDHLNPNARVTGDESHVDAIAYTHGAGTDIEFDGVELRGVTSGAMQGLLIESDRITFHHGTVRQFGQAAWAYDHGIYIASGTDAEIHHTIVRQVYGGWGAQIYPSAVSSWFYNNTFYDTTHAIILGGETGTVSNTVTIENNIFHTSSASVHMEAYWGGTVGTNNVFQDNALYNPGTAGIDTTNGGFTSTGNITADPQFVNAATGDFRTQNAAVVGKGAAGAA